MTGFTYPPVLGLHLTPPEASLTQVPSLGYVSLFCAFLSRWVSPALSRRGCLSACFSVPPPGGEPVPDCPVFPAVSTEPSTSVGIDEVPSTVGKP